MSIGKGRCNFPTCWTVYVYKRVYLYALSLSLCRSLALVCPTPKPQQQQQLKPKKYILRFFYYIIYFHLIFFPLFPETLGRWFNPSRGAISRCYKITIYFSAADGDLFCSAHCLSFTRGDFGIVIFFFFLYKSLYYWVMRQWVYIYSVKVR